MIEDSGIELNVSEYLKAANLTHWKNKADPFRLSREQPNGKPAMRTTHAIMCLPRDDGQKGCITSVLGKFLLVILENGLVVESWFYFPVET